MEGVHGSNELPQNACAAKFTFRVLIFGVGVGWPRPEIEKYVPRNYIWRIVFNSVLAKSRMPNITNPL